MTTAPIAPADDTDDAIAIPAPVVIETAVPLPDLARQVAAAKVMKDLITERDTAARVAVEDALKQLNALTGSTQVEVKIPGRTDKVASISLAQSKDRVIISDTQAFTDWIEERYPDEVVYEVRVRDSFAKTFTEKIVKKSPTGEALLLNESTGETEVVPGLRTIIGGEAKGISLRFAPGGAQAVADMVNGASMSELVGSDAPVIDVTPAEPEAGAA